MKLGNVLTVLVFTGLSSVTFADETPWQVGVEYGVGGLDMDLGYGMDSDPIIGQWSIALSYDLDPTWAIEVAYHKTDSDDFDLLLDYIIFENEFVADSLTVSGLANLQMTENNSFFVKLGLLAYDYEIERRVFSSDSENGIGVQLGAGWEYAISERLSTHLGYQYFDFGDVETATIALGFNFRML